ncbi:MFS transporter [Streptomyces albidoflavus]|uniref:MFS transporter n=1 Tax=Streptomyces albidoflavus TaxID=1886 RepID=UPI0033AC2DE9
MNPASTAPGTRPRPGCPASSSPRHPLRRGVRPLHPGRGRPLAPRPPRLGGHHVDAWAAGQPDGARDAVRVDHRGLGGDLYGRRLPMAVSLAVLSLSMLLSAVAGDLTLFAATRFLTGMGTGALIPLVTAYVSEAAAPARHSLQVGAAQTGIAFGGIIAGVVGSTLLPSWDFHTLFHFGVVPLLLVPVVWRLVPATLPGAGRRPPRAPKALPSPPRAPPPAGSARCWPPGRRRTTLFFWAATFAGPVIVYGASTWLPTLMADSGYDLSSSLEFSIALNAGAVLGTLAAAAAAVVVVADRGFLKAATLTSFLCATVAMITRQHPAAPARTAARLRRRRLRRPRYPGPGQHLRRSRAPCPAARHRARLQPGGGPDRRHRRPRLPGGGRRPGRRAAGRLQRVRGPGRPRRGPHRPAQAGYARRPAGSVRRAELRGDDGLVT